MSQETDCRKIARLLPALPDGDLPPPEAARVQAHLAGCPACREEAQALLGLGELLRQVPAPDANLPTGAQAVVWIEKGLPGKPGAVPSQRDRMTLAPLLRPTALVALGMAACVIAWRAVRPPDAAWEVERLAGAPRVGAVPMGATGRLKVGEWLVTDRASKAQIELAGVGQVKVEPNTRLRLVEARPNEHRLALARGALQARVSAPPRLLFVETPSAVAVDLGCAYRLSVDRAGSGLLQVTLGQVALARNGRETVVPAGARCETRPGIGPGTPYFDDAPAVLRNALEQLDFENGGARALGIVLAAARRRDSLTLWQLLLKLSPAAANQVYDRLAALVPPPPCVTRAGILRHDARMLDFWQTDIEIAE